MITKKGKMPITGTNKAMKPKAPAQGIPGKLGQKQIKQPPQPFANKLGTVNLPVKGQLESKGTDYAVEPGQAHDIRSGIRSNPVGVKGLPSGAPVGQKKPINQSGQVFGPKGISHPRKVGSQNLGKAKRNASFYGE